MSLLTFAQDPEPMYVERDNEVVDLCEEAGVEVKEYIAQTLWNPQE